jgi:hypothetical protein
MSASTVMLSAVKTPAELSADRAHELRRRYDSNSEFAPENSTLFEELILARLEPICDFSGIETQKKTRRHKQLEILSDPENDLLPIDQQS